MANDPHIKACRTCGVEKPATEDFFQSFTNGGRRGLRHVCRLCRGRREGAGRHDRPRKYATDADRKEAANARRRVAQNPEWAARNNARRRARYAGDAVYRASVLEGVKADRLTNPERHKVWRSRSYAKNAAAGSDYQKRRYAGEDKAEKLAKHKAWRDKNPDKQKAIWKRNYEKNKAVHKARAERWRINNPDAVSAARDRRRARVAGATGTYTRNDVRRLLDSSGRACFYCSNSLEKYHVDHFIPLARGGTNHPTNLRIACESCNCSKGAKMPWEWKPDRFRPGSS